MWLGVFVCKDCAETHLSTFGGNQFSYVKDVYNEQWDDYQLRSICFGGNQPLFQIMKEYQIDNTPLQAKYRHACINWYQKRHTALMDGLVFDLEKHPKPPRDWNEKMSQTKDKVVKGSQIAGANLKVAGGVIKENSIVAGAVISEKAGIAKEKAGALKQKIIEK